MKSKKRLWTVCVMALAAIVVMLGACAPAPEVTPPPPPPEEEWKPEKFVFYHFGDISGPYAPITAPIATATADFADWCKENNVTVAGVPIDDAFRDSGGKLDICLSAY